MELPRSRNLRRIVDPADSGCEGSPNRGRTPSLAQRQRDGWFAGASLHSTITGLLRSARHRRHVPGDAPDKACQLTGDRRRDNIGRWDPIGHAAVFLSNDRPAAVTTSRLRGAVGVNAAATTAKRAWPARSSAFSAIRRCQLPAHPPYARAERDIRLPKLFESAMLPSLRQKSGECLNHARIIT